MGYSLHLLGMRSRTVKASDPSLEHDSTLIGMTDEDFDVRRQAPLATSGSAR